MDPIKLLDVANPKKIKDTVNLLIENYENFGDTVQAIADKAAEDSAAALIAGEAAKQIAEESAEALEEAIASQNITIENAIDAQDEIIAQNTTTSNSAKQIAEEALAMIEQADARSEAATETAEDALGLANEAISTSELAMNVATEAKSTVDQAISTGVFGTFVHNTAGISLLHAYMTDNLNQENTDENFYMATPKLVRDALSNISAGNLLIGTEDDPIILSTDIEDGKSYLIGGYFKMYPSTVDSFIYHFPTGSTAGTMARCVGIGTDEQGRKIIEVYGWSLVNLSLADKEAEARNGNFVQRIYLNPDGTSGVSYNAYVGLRQINYKSNVSYIWAPTSGGTAGQILKSNGNNAPTWIDNITVDSELSETSTNPVQNNIITTKLQQIEELIPTTLSELTEDTTHRLVTDTEKATWNSKSDFSGSYNDLTDKPSIPNNNNQLTNGAGYVTQTEVNTSVATKTAVNVNGALQQTLNFDSDPQSQLDDLKNIFITLTENSGTLTQEQFNILNNNPNSYIVYANRTYYRQFADNPYQFISINMVNNLMTQYVYGFYTLTINDNDLSYSTDSQLLVSPEGLNSVVYLLDTQSNQTITGEKNFTNLKLNNNTPLDTQSNQTITGEKNFTNLKLNNNTPLGIVDSGSIGSSETDFYIRLDNNIQICFGYRKRVGNNTLITVQPYRDAEYSVQVTQRGVNSSWSDNMKARNLTTTSFNVNTGGDTGYCWLCIGYWQ